MHINIMVCKGNMNFTQAREKMAGNRRRGSRHQPGPFRGRAPGKSGILYHSSGHSQQKRGRFWDFRTAAESLSSHLDVSLGSDRTDGDGVAVQSAGYGGILTGLLVERGQNRLVARVQGIDLVSYDQGILGPFRYAR